MVTDLLGGSVQVVIGDQANLMPHVQSGKLRALAVATSKRSPNAPGPADDRRNRDSRASTRRRGRASSARPACRPTS